MVSTDYYITKPRQEQLAKIKAAGGDRAVIDHDAVVNGESAMGTVGAVALDEHGNLAAASSTGGMSNKMRGRVGDTPLIGCGTFATTRVAVTGTGRGEAFIQRASAARVAYSMQFGGLDVKAAVENALDDMDAGDGGFIAVDAQGHWTMLFNSGGMFRGSVSDSTAPAVAIW
jgi:beta-aspartyl-peptidase (threonine type)